MSIRASGGNGSLPRYSLHRSHRAVGKDNGEALYEAIKKDYHDLKLRQGYVVVVEGCEEQNVLA